MTFRLGLIAAALVAPLGIAATAVAQSQDDAAAAQQMINDPNPANFTIWGVTPPPKSKKDDSVQGGRSVAIPTTGKGNVWDVSVNVPITKPVKAGDKLEMMYFAKLVKAPAGVSSARINAQIQIASAPYTAVIGDSAELGTEWKLFTVAGRADKDYAKGTLNATFHLNTGEHTIGMGLVAVFDQGQ